VRARHFRECKFRCDRRLVIVSSRTHPISISQVSRRSFLYIIYSGAVVCAVQSGKPLFALHSHDIAVVMLTATYRGRDEQRKEEKKKCENSNLAVGSPGAPPVSVEFNRRSAIAPKIRPPIADDDTVPPRRSRIRGFEATVASTRHPINLVFSFSFNQGVRRGIGPPSVPTSSVPHLSLEFAFFLARPTIPSSTRLCPPAPFSNKQARPRENQATIARRISRIFIYIRLLPAESSYYRSPSWRRLRHRSPRTSLRRRRRLQRSSSRTRRPPRCFVGRRRSRNPCPSPPPIRRRRKAIIAVLVLAPLPLPLQQQQQEEGRT